MAAKSELSTVPAKNPRLEEIKWMLQEMDCPFIEDDDDSWVLSFFQPCEARMRLLSWLIEKFDPKFGEILSKQMPSVDHRIESRVQKMLFICNLLGVCRADDLELIKGTASKKKQMIFLENLLELVLTSDKANFVVRKERSNPDFSSTSQNQLPSEREMFEKSCRFIDNLVRQEDVTELFASSVTLFPPDLEKGFTEDADKKKYRSSAPDNSVLEEIKAKLTADIDNTMKEYNRVKKKFQCNELTQSELDGYCKKFSLTITMLNQLINNFLHCYESDLRHWCNRPKVKKSGLGPASRTTFEMLASHGELFEQMESLRYSHSALENNIAKDIGNKQTDPGLMTLCEKRYLTWQFL
ncbi:uncharacterized protein LOC135693815 isoform X2 [Rhopilema esculentum]|uniref:uncharacterized protein LOC135693815 isoform X2 n=1 Tax=Rhopilema esculentum TaxID=499914 RepID=UPI0031E24AFB